MRATYEVRVSESVQEAWKLFTRGPEVFVAIVFGAFALAMVLTPLPAVGPLIGLLLSAFTPAAVFLAAQDASRRERIGFSFLERLTPIAPQLLMLFVVKSILIGLGLLLLVLPGIYLAVIFAFAELFVVLEGKSFLTALRASKELADRNLVGVFGLCVVLSLLAFSGMLLFLLGLLVTVPLALLTLYSVFRRIHIRVVD